MRGTSGNNSWSPFISYLHQRFANCLTSCQPRMYADETHITYADVDVNSIQLNLNHDLGNLNKWLTSNKLTLSIAKTELLYANWIKTKTEYFVEPIRALD